jgi:teichoic acid transport system ATP-binding protein
MCSEVMWLDHGKLMMRGDPEEVITAYMKFVKVKKSATAMEDI